MRSALDAGFIFWGLFACFAFIVALYLAWMLWAEREAPGPEGRQPGPGAEEGEGSG